MIWRSGRCFWRRSTLEFDALLSEQWREDEYDTNDALQAQRMLIDERGENDGENLSSGHYEREDERAELLNGHEDEYLTNGTGQREKDDMWHGAFVVFHELNRFKQLVLMNKTGHSEDAWVNVAHEHERHAGHWVAFDERLLPIACVAIADQVADQANEAGQGGDDHWVGTLQVVDVTEQKHA